MALFRKKPVVIEAWQFIPKRAATHEEYLRLKAAQPAWLLAAFESGKVYYQGGSAPYLTIETPEGDMRAVVGDWIIRGVKEEIYPCKPDIFELTYEAASPTPPDNR